MTEINFFKRFSYQPLLKRIVRIFHLQQFARKVYYRLNRPAGGIFQLNINKISAYFYVRTPLELRAVEFEMVYEQYILEKLISLVQPGDTIYDIGANIGFYTVSLAKAVGVRGRVITFEPMSENYRHLRDNIELNGLTNVRTFQVALADWNGKGELYLTASKENISGLPSLIPHHLAIDREVEVAEGDRLIETNRLPIPQLVKIDVEGSEYAVIRGLRQTLNKPNCKFVLCEIHPQLLPAGLQPKQIFDELKSYGFTQINICHRGMREYHILAQKLNQ
jgi:FkbM family methyltransferase